MERTIVRCARNPMGARAFGGVPSLIRRRNLGSGQTSFGFLALSLLLPWPARRSSMREGTGKSVGVARQGIGRVYRDDTIRT